MKEDLNDRRLGNYLMKEEYNTYECAVCSAPADGLHYGAISCRSCNAFFRRTVVEKAEYRCKYHNNCIIDADGRCSCRSCRFSKCIEAGMKASAVQPKRDPTGSQKERRKRNASNFQSYSTSVVTFNNNCSSDVVSSGSYIIDAIHNDFGFTTPWKSHFDWSVSLEDVEKDSGRMSCETDEGSDMVTTGTNPMEEIMTRRCNTPTNTGQQEFRSLITAYCDHQNIMRLSFTPAQAFFGDFESETRLRPMDPNDVEQLSTVELNGLVFWINQLYPYSNLSEEDKDVLLKRYSVRKLSLDHFYVASKYPENGERREFVMNNYTYVPSDRTGFELPNEDPRLTIAKVETFASTFSRFWQNVIFRFAKMDIQDAEIVFLQIMLLWTVRNEEHVSQPTKSVMKERRDWAMGQLFEWYVENNFNEPAVRFGEITFLFGEIETVCDMHCQDFQVAKLFELIDMSKFWYESLCYDECNMKHLNIDPFIMKDLQAFNALGVEKTEPVKPLTKEDANELWGRINVFDGKETGKIMERKVARRSNLNSKNLGRRQEIRKMAPEIRTNHRRSDEFMTPQGFNSEMRSVGNHSFNGTIDMRNENGMEYMQNNMFYSNREI